MLLPEHLKQPKNAEKHFLDTSPRRYGLRVQTAKDKRKQQKGKTTINARLL